MRPYPKLMRPKGPDFVVLFENPTSGMVVYSNDEQVKFGTILRHLVEDDFEDVAETDIILISEGPAEHMLEAIEMAHKVRNLKQADDEEEISG